MKIDEWVIWYFPQIVLQLTIIVVWLGVLAWSVIEPKPWKFALLCVPFALLTGLWGHNRLLTYQMGQRVSASVTHRVPQPLPSRLLVADIRPLIRHEYLKGTGLREIVLRGKWDRRRGGPMDVFDVEGRPKLVGGLLKPNSQIAVVPDEYLDLRIGQETQAAQKGLAKPFVGGPFELWHVGPGFEHLVAAGGPEFLSDRTYWGTHGANHQLDAIETNLKSFLSSVLRSSPIN